jgi:hypothetical protein
MSHSYSRFSFTRLVVLIVLPLLSGAYVSFAGGDHYEIYLNKKLVSKQFVSHTTSVLNMQLDKSNYNDEITVYYSHCGIVGRNKSIMLKDDKGNLVKEWKFSDDKSKGAMTISVKEILDLRKTNGKLNLYYAAKELPEGRMLAAVNFNNKNTAANRQSVDYYDNAVSIVFAKLALLL